MVNMWSIFCIFTICTAVMMVDCAPAAAPAGSGDCGSLIYKLTDCLQFLSVDGTDSKPAAKCCSGFKEVLEINAHCICVGLEDAAAMGLTIDMEKAKTIPAACSLSAPPISSCNISTSTRTTGASPVNSPQLAPHLKDPTLDVPTLAPTSSPLILPPSANTPISLPTATTPALPPSTIISTLPPSINTPTLPPTLPPTTTTPAILSPYSNTPTMSPTSSIVVLSPTNAPTLPPLTTTPTLPPSINKPTLPPSTNTPTLPPTISTTTPPPTISTTTPTPLSSTPTLSPTTKTPTLPPYASTLAPFSDEALAPGLRSSGASVLYSSFLVSSSIIVSILSF